MIVLVKDRPVDLAQLCVDLRNEGFTHYQITQQLFDYAYHHGLPVPTNELAWLAAAAFR
jgi:hypothetical protein